MHDTPPDPAADDPELAPFAALPTRLRTEEIVVEGELPVRRLLASGVAVHAVLCTPAKRALLAPLLAPETRVIERDPAFVRRLVGYGFHRGVIALALRPALASAFAPALIDALRARGRSVIVLAERIADGLNLGALLRNAFALGADGVIVDSASADPWSRKCVRASVGNVFRLPSIVTADPLAAVRALRGALGSTLVAAHPGDGAHALDGFAPPPHLVVAFGNEGEGLSPAVLAAADSVVSIPIRREADSLNVAAASAIVLHALGQHRAR